MGVAVLAIIVLFCCWRKKKQDELDGIKGVLKDIDKVHADWWLFIMEQLKNLVVAGLSLCMQLKRMKLCQFKCEPQVDVDEMIAMFNTVTMQLATIQKLDNHFNAFDSF